MPPFIGYWDSTFENRQIYGRSSYTGSLSWGYRGVLLTIKRQTKMTYLTPLPDGTGDRYP